MRKVLMVLSCCIALGMLFTGTNEATVKALYEDASLKHNGITSEDIPLQSIPEPASMLLQGSGLLTLAGFLRRHINS